MKALNIIYITGLLLIVISCQKETIDFKGEVKAIEERSTVLTADFKTKTKKLKATNLSKKASLTPRYNHTSLVFDDRMWILGGNLPKVSNHVLSSGDGANWKDITMKANFPYRSNFGATVFQNKMWLAGGVDKPITTSIDNLKNDVWFSTNGTDWKRVILNAKFQKRAGHTLTAFKGALWLIGGQGFSPKTGNNIAFGDIWRSFDGMKWHQVTDNAAFGVRRWHASIVYDDKLWVLGGGSNSYQNDVWYTENGHQWIQATDMAAFSPRGLHTLTSDGKRMWLTSGHAMQGKGEGYKHQNDIWYSSNGIKWYKANTSKKFPKRTQHSSVFFDNKLWVINGFGPADSAGYPILFDIWSFE